MLPDKNKLNDKMIEQINGGFGEKLKGIDDKDDEELTFHPISHPFTCSNCGSMYSAITRRTDGFCPNCEPKPIPKIAPVGDLKTTVPDLPNKNMKIH